MTPTLQVVPKHFTTAELNKLLALFPPNAIIRRTEVTATVHLPDGTTILSAALLDGELWHVMAPNDLIVPKDVT